MARPSKLTEALTTELVKQLSLGMYLEEAAAVVGISRSQLHEWLKRGAREVARRERFDELKFTERAHGSVVQRQRATKAWQEKLHEHEQISAQEQLYVDFSEKVKSAMSTATSSMLGVITRAALGGAVIETVTTSRTLADGSVEKTVVEKKARPEWTAAAWRLERRSPSKWGRRLEFMERAELPSDEELASGLDAVERLKAKLMEMKAAKEKTKTDDKKTDKKEKKR